MNNRKIKCNRCAGEWDEYGSVVPNGTESRTKYTCCFISGYVTSNENVNVIDNKNVNI